MILHFRFVFNSKILHFTVYYIEFRDFATKEALLNKFALLPSLIDTNPSFLNYLNNYKHKSIMSIGSVYETAYRGDFNQVKVKVDEDNALINRPDSNQRLLIHWAALGGNKHLVDFLIDLGSPIDPLDDTNSTPLILSSSAGRVDVVKLLLSKGANVNQKTNRGQSSLHYACSKGHFEVSKLLIEYDANVNDADVLNATPLHRAAAQGRSNIVELLLASPHIKVDVCDSTGSTPLHIACEEDREAVACMLVKAGANMELANKDKKTPLELSSSPKLRNILRAIVI
ncbi:26S proteasome non-ATPase regulatory subunit 10-like [Helicoverpa zea]|uniref:26S proteasome non-ATPase regulatory subunit 10-like n=1 Tax=Helicoverpa zea TaxID=7113 RepID=UPI001F5ACAA2|nr:26S proteasome non-ATPase regulatory subunit 10-like [Helicoverpa zea]